MPTGPNQISDPSTRLGRGFAWAVVFLLLPLLVTGGVTAAYLRAVLDYRVAVERAYDEVAGVLLRDVLDVVFARSSGPARLLLNSGLMPASTPAGARPMADRDVLLQVQVAIDSLQACQCPRLPVRGLAILTPTTGAIEVLGGDPAATRERASQSLQWEEAEPGRLWTAAGGDAQPWFLFLARTDPEVGASRVVVLDVDPLLFGPAVLEPAFRFVLETHDLTRETAGDGISLEVTHPGGLTILASGRPSDGPSYLLPVFGPDLSSSSLPGTEPFAARLTVHPDALAGLIPGGVPGSPVPVVVASLLMALSLSAAGVFLLFRLRRFSLQRERFVSTVSHELRTPLALLLAYAETLGLERPAPESRRRAATVIIRETRRMIGLVENALAFSKGQASTAGLSPELVEFGVALREIAADFEPIAAARSVQIQVSGWEVYGVVDRSALRQMVNNLLDNAVRYGPVGGVVEVAAAHADGWVQVAVRDRGPGIPADRCNRVWDPFVTYSMGGTHAGGGTGLGLSIVRQLAEVSDGAAEVRARPQGGSEFVLIFPAAAPSETH